MVTTGSARPRSFPIPFDLQLENVGLQFGCGFKRFEPPQHVNERRKFAPRLIRGSAFLLHAADEEIGVRFN